ncbi:hypothetical protein F5Y15DRAFT_396839 [Xylariaceae sp. FL0016]|nr:hypothetical protein F5Y15DRAFT_396839 [Xylariaceae sp. FL0016]
MFCKLPGRVASSIYHAFSRNKGTAMDTHVSVGEHQLVLPDRDHCYEVVVFRACGCMAKIDENNRYANRLPPVTFKRNDHCAPCFLHRGGKRRIFHTLPVKCTSHMIEDMRHENTLGW